MLIRDARRTDGRVRDVRVEDGRIARVDSDLTAGPEERIVEADGRLLLPGAIDVHVHFRQPGFGHKETWETGSRSAAAGGVTAVVDQPNTAPPTVTGAAFDEKASLAASSHVDFGIDGGVTEEWDPDSLFERPLFALGEVFLADSTGEMGIERPLFEDAVERAAAADVVVTVHAEDADLFDEAALAAADDGRGREADADAWSAFRTPEAELAAVERAVEVGRRAGARIHIAHASTPEGVDAAVAAGATCEVTPHHIYLSRDDLSDLGTFGRMNPPLRDETRREELFARVADGTVDVIATDHAPHTREEKDATILEAPSGVPGVETMLPLLLESARRGDLSYERVEAVTARNPARVFDLPRKGRIEEGRDADIVLVDPDAPRQIRGDDLHSKCGWTPFEGRQGVFPELTLVRGQVAYADPDGVAGDLLDDGPFGDAVGENVRAG